MENHHEKRRNPARKLRSHNGRASSKAHPGRASALFDAVSEVAEDQFEAATEMVNDYVEQGRSQVRQLGRRIESKVAKHPWQILLGAVGLGILAGLFLRRR